MSTATTVDTAKVTGRRELHFHNLDDIRADVEQLAQAHEIRALGNWSPGQVFKHLATIMNKCIDGFDRRLPWPVRFVLRLLFKRKFLTQPMKAGFQLPAKTATEIVPPATSLEEGLLCIRQALDRLQMESKRAPSAFLGPLTRDEWDQLHCRHAELHLSFLIPVA
jgi:hypothetical protein